MLKIYVAAPYSTGNQAHNVKAAIRMGDFLASHGFAPFIPHLTHFWDMMYPQAYAWWLSYDLEWLKHCDALIRIPGESPGAEKEVEFARKNKIPVFIMQNEFDFGTHMISFLNECKVNSMAKQ